MIDLVGVGVERGGGVKLSLGGPAIVGHDVMGVGGLLRSSSLSVGRAPIAQTSPRGVSRIHMLSNCAGLVWPLMPGHCASTLPFRITIQTNISPEVGSLLKGFSRVLYSAKVICVDSILV